jgi:hypothetical protein
MKLGIINERKSRGVFYFTQIDIKYKTDKATLTNCKDSNDGGLWIPNKAYKKIFPPLVNKETGELANDVFIVNSNFAKQTVEPMSVPSRTPLKTYKHQYLKKFENMPYDNVGINASPGNEWMLYINDQI